MKYFVRIIETFTYTATIEAPDGAEAMTKLKHKIRRGQLDDVNQQGPSMNDMHATLIEVE